MTRDDLDLNDALRFGLELAALASLAYWGWATVSAPFRLVATVGLPGLAAVLWGVFRVPGDPGDAPVAVPGPVRLGLEVVLLGGAVAALWSADQPTFAAVLGGLLVVHYVVARDRVYWLIGEGFRAKGEP